MTKQDMTSNAFSDVIKISKINLGINAIKAEKAKYLKANCLTLKFNESIPTTAASEGVGNSR